MATVHSYVCLPGGKTMILTRSLAHFQTPVKFHETPFQLTLPPASTALVEAFRRSGTTGQRWNCHVPCPRETHLADQKAHCYHQSHFQSGKTGKRRFLQRAKGEMNMMHGVMELSTNDNLMITHLCLAVSADSKIQ